jgi:outer membrane protein assembly factor BamA
VLSPLLFALILTAAGQASGEVVVEVRVHGNLATPDEEILRLAGVRIGDPFAPDTPAVVAARLRAARRFDNVEVLKRYASIADPTLVLLVIVVDEGPVSVDWSGGDRARVVRRRGPRPMFLPVLDFEDGYGFTYGLRLALPEPVGERSLVSFPLTWGGRRSAAAVLETQPGRGPLTRVEAGASRSRRTHPFFDRHDDRTRVWARGERELAGGLRLGATAGLESVSFLDRASRVGQVGADLTFDTRLDPAAARNAIFARVAWDHFGFDDQGRNQLDLDVRGYVGLVGQPVLVLRALRRDADGALPPYLKPMLGGMDTVRGFPAGAAVGDTLVAGSAELVVPLTSPLNFGKAGVSAFVDVGAAYDDGDRMRDQAFARGVGASWWFSAAFLRASVAVARGLGTGTRVHFGTSLTF